MMQDVALSGEAATVTIATIGLAATAFLALVACIVTLWNNQIARRIERATLRTEDHITAQTNSLKKEISALKVALATAGLLDAAKDATIAAHETRNAPPRDVVIVGTEKPVPVIDETPSKKKV